MAEKLAQLFLALVKSVVCGHESASYKVFGTSCCGNNNGIVSMTASFYNHVYDTLASKDDCPDNCAAKIKAMQDCTGHSPICLLNMLMTITVEVHTSLESKKLDIKSYENFMESVGKEVNAKLPDVRILTAIFDHKCNGDQEVKAGEKMFHVVINHVGKYIPFFF